MFKFDGKHASEYFDKVLLVKRDMAAPSSPILQELRDKPGAYFFGIQTGVYEVEFEVFIQGNDRQDLWKKIRKANAWLKQGELKRLEFDDEPDLYYEAVCVDNLELDEILEYGFGTIKFIAPDPYAFGKTQKQSVDSPNVVFDRIGIRYREDGSEVTENYPVYKAGKFGEAVLVEEGTTNLLNTAASPEQEEVSVEVGDDYYLFTIGGSATVEHKHTETLPKTTLDKEGTDISHTADWTSGTHNGTELNGYLQLAKSGTDFTNTQPRISVNTPAYRGDYVGQNDCSSLAGWTTSQTGSYSVVNGTIIVVDSSSSDNAYIYRNNTVNNPGTLDFRLKAEGVGRINVQDGTNEFRFNAPNTNGEFKWYRIRVNGTTARLYENGTLIQTVSPAGTGTNKYISFYLSPADIGSYEIDHLAWANKDMGAPPENGIWFISGESIWYDVTPVGLALSSQVTFTANTATIDGSGLAKVEYQLDDNGTIGNYTEVNSGDSIPGITKGKNLSGVKYRKKFNLQTMDPTSIVYLDNWTDKILSGYLTSGYRESAALNINQVGKAASTSISWVNQSIPAGTSVKVETSLSLDGGNTWSGYTEVTNGGTLPGIDQTTDLSDARLRYKVTLETTDVAVTPSVDSLTINLVSGYKASETVELPSFDVSNIGFAENSVVELPEVNGDASTSVTFEYSIDGGQTWNPMTNGQPFIQNEDLTGKLLKLRYTLETNDTRYAPIIGNSLTWFIQQQERNKIKPATQTIRVTPNGAARWQLEKKPYATGWHNTGTREPEALMVWVKHLAETWESEGAISFWFHDDGIKKQQFPTILDTIGDIYRIKFYKDVANGEYVLEVGGNVVLTASIVTGWNHFVLTWDNSNGYLYMNGSQVGTFDRNNFPLYFNGMNYLWFGSSRDKTDHLNGLIDEIALFNHKIDEEEISQLYQEPAKRKPGVNIYHLDGNLVSDNDTSLVYEGTAETFPKFTITFARDSSYFRVANGRDFVLVNYDFKAGDVLEIDNQKEFILLNGGPIMKAISLDSDFFEIRNGDEIIVDPAGFANVDIEFVERWV